MHKVGDLMRQLGFREDGSDEVKIAFVRNLFRAAYGYDLPSPKQTKQKQRPPVAPKWEQLTFDFSNHSESASKDDSAPSEISAPIRRKKSS